MAGPAAGPSFWSEPILWLTSVLVLATIYYAWQTHAMVKEMRKARTDELEDRKHRRSREEAAICLDALEDIEDRSRARGTAALDPNRLYGLHQVLRRHAPLVIDEEIRERLTVCSAVAFTASWNDAKLGGSRDLAVAHASGLFAATRGSVHAYLSGEPVPDWRDFPRVPNAQAWLIELSRGEEPKSLPDDS